MSKRLIFIALLLFALSACKKTPEEDIVPVSSVTISQNEVTLKVGETFKLKAQVKPENATEQTLEWTSSDQSVVTVSNDGFVTAVGEGTAIVTVTAGGKSATSTFIVSKAETPVTTVHVESVSLDKTDAQLEVGGTLDLTATVLPDNATDKSVTWKSTNPEIAEVDQNGKVTAISSGTVTISVTTTDGEKVATCEIAVAEVFVPVESVQFEHPELIVFRGDSYQINVTVLPENATNKTITWTSSDESIATITQEGIITGVGYGWVTITAKAGDIEATCNVIGVENPDNIDDPHDGEEEGHRYVDLGLPSGIKWATCNIGARSSREIGDMFAWGETFAKTDGENPPYKWRDQSTNKLLKYVNEPRYGTVDNLTILEPDDDAAHVQWGGKWRMPTKADCQELIDNCEYESIEQNGVRGAKLTSKINSQTIFFISGTYHTSSLDESYSQNSMLVYFEDFISDSGFATTNRECLAPVRPVIGTSEYVPVESLEADISYVQLAAGEQRTLSVRVLPENATNNKVAWFSDDQSVARVDQNGNMTAVSKGYTYIRAYAGGKSYSFYVYVVPAFERLSIDPADMTLLIGETASITVTVTPSDLLDYYYYYTTGYNTQNSGAIEFINVDYNNNGKTTFTIIGKAGGEAVIEYYINVDGNRIPVSCHVTVPYVDDDYDGETDGHKWVDLGLPSGVKWATCNVGSIYSFQFGSNFAWGETTPNDDNSAPYRWYDPATGKYLKYVTDSEFGAVDNLTTLEAEDDAATANWGGEWRMPTQEDIDELCENTTYEIVEQDGLSCGKITSKINSHSIFLPLNGYYEGYYLSSSLYSPAPNRSWCISAGYSEFDKAIVTRGNKYAVRAVIGNPPYIPVESVDFDFTHIWLNVGDVKSLSVTLSPSNATKKKITWSSSNESVAVVDSHGNMTCVGVGYSTIYAEADGKRDSFTLCVDPEIKSLTLDPDELYLTVGQSALVTVKMDPEFKPATYGTSSFNPSVFDAECVSENPFTYRVTAREEGVGYFGFQAGGKTATCYVTVTGE